jgi:hypothetical protein
MKEFRKQKKKREKEKNKKGLGNPSAQNRK